MELWAGVEQDFWTFCFAGVFCQDADGAVGVQAVNQPGARSGMDPQTLASDGHPSIVSHTDTGAAAPYVVPPRIRFARTQDAAFGAPGPLPGLLRRHVQFAVVFPAVVMLTQFLQQRIGQLDPADGFGGKECGQAVLPVMVQSLHLALGLRRGGVEAYCRLTP